MHMATKCLIYECVRSLFRHVSVWVALGEYLLDECLNISQLLSRGVMTQTLTKEGKERKEREKSEHMQA